MEQTDWHDQEEDRFLQRLASRLDAEVNAGNAKSVIMVAPPRALGVLRKAYSHALRGALRAEVDKDYAKDHHLRLGSPIPVTTPTGKVLRLRLKGIFDPPNGGSLQCRNIMLDQP